MYNKLGSLTSLALLTTTGTATIVRKGTQHNSGTVGLWFKEGKFVLYLISQTTCKVGLCCGDFSVFCTVF